MSVRTFKPKSKLQYDLSKSHETAFDMRDYRMITPHQMVIPTENRGEILEYQMRAPGINYAVTRAPDGTISWVPTYLINIFSSSY